MTFLKKYNLSRDGKTVIKTYKSFSNRLLYAAYHAIQLTNNIGDISSIKPKELPKCDFLTYSFPCQDLSLQGKQAGLYNGNSSSLLWEVKRIIDGLNYYKKKPKYLLMENVSSILNINHKQDLNKWINHLKNLGYKSHLFTLNSKYFNIPQNRNRAFLLSELKQNKFIVPEEIKITNKTLKNIIDKSNITEWKPSKGKIHNWNPKVKESGIAMTMIENYTSFGSESSVFSLNSIAPTVTATGARSRIKIIHQPNKIRMLTSEELWKLMGFAKSDWKNATKHNLIPEQHLIKQAGNSIVVNVLEVIFKNVQ